MKKLTFCSGIAVAAVLAASGAEAAQCEGIGARKSAAPVIIHKAEDGAMTMLIRSTGTNTIISPAEMTGGANWQHCVGFWTVNADKSSAGAGNCYALDAAGDQWITSWEGGNGGGTWAHVSGTGKYAARSNAGGNWKPGARFADGMRLTLWDGTCGD
jgi:hypothetical protein